MKAILARETRDLAARHYGLDLTGLDLSEAMLREARRPLSGSRSRAPNFVQGSVYELPFEDNSFDVVLNTISCHFYLEQVKAFKEIQRVTRPGGRFFCAAIAGGLLGGVPASSITRVAVYYPVYILDDHFEAAGFKIIGREWLPPNVRLYRLAKL